MQVPFPAASHPSKTTSVGTWAARSARWSSPMRISRGSRTVRYSLWERERERSRVSSIGARILLPTAAPVRYTGGMFRGLLALLLVASAGAAAARRLAFAVLPLRPLAECAPAIARRFTRLLEQRLRARGARVV